jgi:hypothetical protein
MSLVEFGCTKAGEYFFFHERARHLFHYKEDKQEIVARVILSIHGLIFVLDGILFLTPTNTEAPHHGS